ncbi:MAG: DUF1949 domain-containing protein [Calditrichaeota bacterium]|nr:MAG: DUF1949 domain-containing protein [Calditrichota bacterium]
MSQPEHHTVTDLTRHQLKVKRSVFIGTLAPAPHREAAEAQVEQVRREFPDATHHCFAYRIDGDTFRYYDDGEPSSTAGKPILSMLDKYRLVQCVLVVTRYFGGTKLGVGGLIQAYSRCAEETIQRANVQPLVHYHHFRVRFPYHFTRHIHHLVHKHGARIDASDYGDRVTAVIDVPEAVEKEFFSALTAIGAGQIQILDVSK